MLDEHLQNPARDESSPPVPNPENPAEAIALKLVEFSPPSERKQTVSPSSERKETVSKRGAEQQMEKQSKTFLNKTPHFADVKRKDSNGPNEFAEKKGVVNKLFSMRRGARKSKR
jgi:hypothetical protein